MKIFLIFLLTINLNLIETFAEISIEVSIKEEEKNGSIIVDLRSYFNSLSFLNNSNGFIIKFARPCLNIYIDEKNSFIIRSLRIDREQFCPYEKNCYLNCDLFIEKEEMKLIKLKINIEDINDHKPKFKKNFYSYEFDENLSKGFRIPLEQAEDKDLSEKNSIKNYHLNVFNLTYFPFELTHDEKNHLLELILIENLEKKSENVKFLFELMVNDGENEEDQCLIEINILKTQHNNYLPPKFDLNLYKFFIFNLNETFIGKVHAKNSLNLNNQQIYYRIIPSIENLNLFQINETSGEIFLNRKQKINFLNKSYEILIEAFYLNHLSSLTAVEIYFNLTYQLNNPSNNNDEQENFIQILIPKLFHKNDNKIFLKENLSVPITILQLFISSSSSSSYSSYSLDMITSIEKDYFYLKKMDQQLFELILLKSFDYELIQKIDLDFILNKQNVTKKSIEIAIENINDCQPYFNQTDFFFTIQENNQIPFLLYTFQAYDQDYLNHIIYQIQTSDENIFSINSAHGDLWISKSFDRELQSNYSLLVCAFDGFYQICSSIYINILDENDNMCKFNSSSITLTINENLPSNINLIQVQAYDPDYEQNGTLLYKLSPKTSYLNIDSTTGIIRTTIDSFDYELIQTYSTLIIACDNINSLPSLCCYLKIYINIIDINDNFPYLIYPSSTNDVFIIDYSNKTMPRLQAFDNDLDLKNRFISYSIIGGSLNSSINVDYLSGQLYLLSTSTIPLYGTLIVSLSSQTNIQLTILLHDNQTDPQKFLMSIQQYSFSSQLFYFISFISIAIIIFSFITIFVILYFFKQKQKQKHDDDPLMNTPSTTTLSARSLVTTTTITNKKFYDTYYSFGDSVNPDIIHV
ncbi:unnamed protein product [Rotaria magnacalcarata]|uniref:Cadherin domain-containing protein n=1 Tax=Rotaria magnacalcarata TaxID=392030 RepID=A0A816GTN2_9BILA|nr:unnamed protein product [Rotaria magnacalcarata]CAF1679396.1 unnamed protein product [Rotaria magnacalcarata]CAF1914667.1 unnamed protein product [Rotaria magnacalcarata]CAF2080499.1 unnamed protein product [Rotaria magnacalcarata]CAF2095593.1 unnamed protein product [Rotaria magnacalcarata]